jgi:hypothetical protein
MERPGCSCCCSNGGGDVDVGSRLGGEESIFMKNWRMLPLLRIQRDDW